MERRSRILLGIFGIAILLVTVSVIRAQGASQLRACDSCGPPQRGGDLPPIEGSMTATTVGEALIVLSFDDGTCESGLGAGTTMAVTDFVEFDAPTQCIPWLQIVALTTRMNTGRSISSFAFGPSGATPPPAGGAEIVPLTAPIPAVGPCPGTTLTSRAIGPGTAIVNATANFFAGMRASGFAGRDTNGPPAGRIWINCSFCGMTQYSPADLRQIGLGGNWMIRVTVEDVNCVPVELMDFDVG